MCLLQRSKKVKQRLESSTGRRRNKRAKKFWVTGSEFAPGLIRWYDTLKLAKNSKTVPNFFFS